MSKALERRIQKVERELLLQHIYEDVYTRLKRKEQRSVRAVAKDGEVELISSDKKALEHVQGELMKDGTLISTTELQPLTEEQIVTALQPHERAAAAPLLGDGQTTKRRRAKR